MAEDGYITLGPLKLSSSGPCPNPPCHTDPHSLPTLSFEEIRSGASRPGAPLARTPKLPGAGRFPGSLRTEVMPPEGNTENTLLRFLVSTDGLSCILYSLNILIHINKLDALL